MFGNDSFSGNALSGNTRALTQNVIVSIVVSTIASLTASKFFSKLLSVASTSIVAPVRKVFKVIIAYGTEVLNLGTLNGLILNALAMNADFTVVTTAPGISSTVTIKTNSVFFKILTAAVTSVVTIIRVYKAARTLTANIVTSLSTIGRTFLKTLSILSTNTQVLRIQVNKLVTVLSSSVATLVRKVLKALTVNQVSVVTMLRLQSLFRTFTVVSSSIVSIRKALTKVLLFSSTTISRLVKKVSLILITLGNKYVMTGTIGSSIFNSLAINTDNPVYTTTTGVTSSATITLNSFYFKALTVLSTSVTTLLRVLSKLKVLTATVVTTTNTVIKQVQKALLFSISIIASVLKQVKLVLITLGSKYVMTGTLGSALFNSLTINTDDPVYTTTTGVNTTATVSASSVYYRALAFLATSSSSLVKSLFKSKVLVSNIVTSTVSLSKQFNINLNAFVSSITTLVKQIKLTLITYGSKFVNTSGLNGLVLNDLAINNEAPASYIYTPGVNSTATVLLRSTFQRLLLVLSTSLSTLTKFRLQYKTLVASTVQSVVTVRKSVNKLINLVSVTVAASLTRLANYFRTLVSAATSTSTLDAIRVFLKALIVLSTSIVTISKIRAVILEALVTSYLTITRIYGKLLVTVVSSFSSIFANVVYFTELLSKIYIYAEDRVRSLNIKKLRTVLTEKVRTVFITKDDIV